MGVRKPHSFLRQAVDVRRRYLRLGVVRRAVAVTHVVGIDNDDVWLICRARGDADVQRREQAITDFELTCIHRFLPYQHDATASEFVAL